MPSDIRITLCFGRKEPLGYHLHLGTDWVSEHRPQMELGCDTCPLRAATLAFNQPTLRKSCSLLNLLCAVNVEDKLHAFTSGWFLHGWMRTVKLGGGRGKGGGGPFLQKILSFLGEDL